jgi:hypothetical protein
MFRVMNAAAEFEPIRTARFPFENPSFPWWLVRRKFMFNVFMNWDVLKAYFTSAELAQSQFDIKFGVRLLKEMLPA